MNEGIFGLAHRLRDDPRVAEDDRRVLGETIEWFNKHVTEPDRFNRSKSKGYYRRATRGISWFRDTASECVARMHQIKGVLETNGHQVRLIRDTRVGYVVYEDELQVVAEPFSDTDTGAGR